MSKIKVEICCFNSHSAINAHLGGADRIEICDNYQLGGTTPSYGTVQYICDNVEIDINVLIRPRGGDFVYDDIEYKVLKNDIKSFKSLDINGIVTGILTKNGHVDSEKMKEIIDLVYPLELTFHRAIDMSVDPFTALDTLMTLRVQRVLTSGGENNALDGMETIRKMVQMAGNDIIIMPGAGINSTNISSILKTTGANEIHTSAKKTILRDNVIQNPKVNLSYNSYSDFDHNIFADIGEIREIVSEIKNI